MPEEVVERMSKVYMLDCWVMGRVTGFFGWFGKMAKEVSRAVGVVHTLTFVISNLTTWM